MDRKNDITKLIWEWLDYNKDVDISRKAHYDLQERFIKLIESWEKQDRQQSCKHSWSHRNDGNVKFCRLCEKIEVS